MGCRAQAGHGHRRTARPRPWPGQELQRLRPAPPGDRLGGHAGCRRRGHVETHRPAAANAGDAAGAAVVRGADAGIRGVARTLAARSEEHTSELQSLMLNSYAVFCLKKKNKKTKIL